MKAIILLLFSAQAFALTCKIEGADGLTYYKQTSPAKTLGAVSAIKPCKDLVKLYPYASEGMRVYSNPNTDGTYPCIYVTVKNNQLLFRKVEVGENDMCDGRILDK